MKVLKKLLFCLLAVLSLALFACKEKTNVETESNEPVETRTLKVLLPSGTPLFAIGNLLDDPSFEFEIVNGQDPLSSALMSGEYDIIIAPINLGAKLYLAGKSSYLLESVITTNNTYIMSYEDLSSIENLKNKTILSFGTNSAPWIAAQLLNEKYELNLTFEEQSSASDVATIFASKTSDAELYLGAEPNITTLQLKRKLEFNVLDVSSYLKEELPFICQACLFVNPNSNVTKEELKKIEDNIKFMNENPADYSKSVVSKNDFFANLGEEVITVAIPKCNISYYKGIDNMETINRFFDLLNPNVLNGKIPDENFYNK